MPSVLVTGATVVQKSPFSALMVGVAIASTHCVYPQSDGQPELAWVAALNSKMAYPQRVTHSITNWARHRVLIESNTLPLSQTTTVHS